ncbi:MAG: DivIVA domain-containing protein [Solirubrobacterales bacterium]
MSATDLDLPVLMSADHIRRREFVAIRRGYDPAQVRDFLEKVADQIQELESIIRESRLEADSAVRAAAQPRVDPYAQLAERVASVLRAADDHSERAKREASAEAERILGEARADADQIRADAQARATEARESADALLREAREQADRTIAGLSTKRDSLVEQLATMQERLVGVARDLESTISDPDTMQEAAARPSPWVLPAETEKAVPEPDEAVPEPDEASSEPDVAPSDRTIVLGDAAATDDPEAELDDEARMALLDPAYEELWDGTEAIALDVPDIPPLDLDWGQGEGEQDDH